jgi:hypothetical protein
MSKISRGLSVIPSSATILFISIYFSFSYVSLFISPIRMRIEHWCQAHHGVMKNRILLKPTNSCHCIFPFARVNHSIGIGDPLFRLWRNINTSSNASNPNFCFFQNINPIVAQNQIPTNPITMATTVKAPIEAPVVIDYSSIDSIAQTFPKVYTPFV